MMEDVEMKMEAQGLPKQFGSTSEQPEPDHIATNAEASIQNAEATSAPAVEVQSTPDQPTLAPTETAPVTTNGFHVEASVNGVAEQSSNELSSVPNSLSEATVDAPRPSGPPADFANSSAANSFADSVISSSVPPEAQESTLTTDLTQPSLDPLSDPLPQPPTSDLRSPPHADALSASQVAEVEAQKHAEDNAAAELPVTESEPSELPLASAVPSEPDQLEPVPVPVPVPVPTSEFPSEPKSSILENFDSTPISTVPESLKAAETGLATPPAHTPPPPPEPAHAELPPEPSKPMDSRSPALAPEVPADPAPTPAEPALLQQPIEIDLKDETMTEAPPVKVAREREEDQNDGEPAAKRIKTDEPESSFKVPEVPAVGSPSPAVSTPTASTPAPQADSAPDGDDSITPPRLSHLKKVISNLKKSNASQNFRQPVDPVALKIPTYPEIVKNPMDLSKIDHKLKNDGYTKISEFVSDFELIVSNCVAFNGATHGVTQQAYKMQSSFRNQMQHLPKAQYSEPSKEEKKAAKLKVEPTRTAPPRRPSVSTTTAPAPQGVAQSPKSAAASTPAFAPGPDGVPLIRRDSNMADGRPKRQIVPPKRNNEYGGGRPKKKKYELQLKFCEEVIKELTSPKNWVMNQYFTHPVDPVALNIPTYFQIIKKPMDLGTVQTKLQNNVYEKAKDFEEDVRLVFKNCYKFNPEGDYVNQQGHALEELFNKKWATKDDWIASREPPSEPQSEVEEEEDSESEDDADDSEAERNDKIALLQKQIAEMSKQMGELTQPKNKKKKSKSPNAPPLKKNKSKSKKDKPKTTFPGLQKTEKKKSISKAKPEKVKWVTFAEKQYISNGIAMLPEKQMSEALRIIQQSVPALASSNEAEIELDIEEVPNHALVQLLNFVKKYAGPLPEETQQEESYVAPSAPPKSKKNKPMSKAQQEAQIQSLKGKLDSYAGGPSSPGAVQSIENDDSSDNDDSEESEED